jgi:CspA family cold shock protein
MKFDVARTRLKQPRSFHFSLPRNQDSFMASGKVKWFDNKMGFGFITEESGQDVFVHHSSILGTGYKTLGEGEPVIFEIITGEKGLKAANVQRAEPT